MYSKFEMYSNHNNWMRQTDREPTNREQTDREQSWLARRAILNICLLSPEPSCPNPHFVTKSPRRNQWQNHCNKIIGSWSVDLARLFIGYTVIKVIIVLEQILIGS